MGGFSTVNPVSAGKLKDLWDAIRTVPDPGAPPPAPLPPPAQPAPALATTAPPPTLPGPASIPPQAGVVAGPDSTPPIATAQMTGPPPDVTPSPLPVVNEAQPDINQMAGSDRVTQLQGVLDNFGKTPGLRERLLAIAPVLASVIAAKAGGGQAGASIRGVAEGQDIQRGQQNLERANLTTQLSAAEQEREREYDTATRTVERANAAADANRTRDLISRMGNQSKENVATTGAGSRVAAATIGAGARTGVADTQAASRQAVAKIAADARIAAGKYAADAAANRQTRSINATAGRQQAGFGHTDTKPTAAEDQRADMAKSFGQVVDEIDGIVQRRPDLVGPVAGRSTQLKNLIGTDDPDVSTLMADKEAIGQFMLAAHSMRNGNHIAIAGNSVLNAFHNEPEAMRAALAAAKVNAMGMDTIVRPTLAGKLPGAGAGAGGGQTTSTTSPAAQPKAALQWTPEKGIH